MTRALFSVALALSCVAPCASAQVFKWVDKDGLVNYGDWPPYGAKLEQMTHGTVSTVAGGPRLRAGETPATNRQRGPQGTQGARPRGDSTQVADDVQYSGVYAADYGYPARRIYRADADAALDRPHPEHPIAEPRPAANLPAVADMPRPVRR